VMKGAREEGIKGSGVRHADLCLSIPLSLYPSISF